MTPTVPIATPLAPYAGRRLDLVAAAERVVARGGLRALTHRAVDAEAGLAEGSCSSYFRTRTALLTALTEHVGHLLRLEVVGLAERLHAALEAEAAGESHERRVAVATAEVAALFQRRIDNPDLVLVQAELALEGQRQPELRAVLDPWRREMTGLVELMVRDAGKPNPALLAETLVAAMQGVLLGGLQYPEGDRTAYLERAIGTLLGSLY